MTAHAMRRELKTVRCIMPATQSREDEIIRLRKAGHSNREVAALLDMHLSTVKRMVEYLRAEGRLQ